MSGGNGISTNLGSPTDPTLVGQSGQNNVNLTDRTNYGSLSEWLNSMGESGIADVAERRRKDLTDAQYGELQSLLAKMAIRLQGADQATQEQVRGELKAINQADIDNNGLRFEALTDALNRQVSKLPAAPNEESRVQEVLSRLPGISTSAALQIAASDQFGGGQHVDNRVAAPDYATSKRTTKADMPASVNVELTQAMASQGRQKIIRWP